MDVSWLVLRLWTTCVHHISTYYWIDFLQWFLYNTYVVLEVDDLHLKYSSGFIGKINYHLRCAHYHCLLQLTFWCFSCGILFFFVLSEHSYAGSIILAVDRRSRVSTSIFTSGRSHQYQWSNNCISHSSLGSYIARRTLFIIAPYWINCMCLSVQKEANMQKNAYKVTVSNCLSADCKHEAYGRHLLIVFNGCVYPGFHSFLLYQFSNFIYGWLRCLNNYIN